MGPSRGHAESRERRSREGGSLPGDDVVAGEDEVEEGGVVEPAGPSRCRATPAGRAGAARRRSARRRCAGTDRAPLGDRGPARAAESARRRWRTVRRPSEHEEASRCGQERGHVGGVAPARSGWPSAFQSGSVGHRVRPRRGRGCRASGARRGTWRCRRRPRGRRCRRSRRCDRPAREHDVHGVLAGDDAESDAHGLVGAVGRRADPLRDDEDGGGGSVTGSVARPGRRVSSGRGSDRWR